MKRTMIFAGLVILVMIMLGSTIQVTASDDVYLTKNPFTESTKVVCELDDPGFVSLRVYDMAGDLVRVLIQDTQVVGSHVIHWDGTNDFGTPLGSGLYVYVFVVFDEGRIRTQKIGAVGINRWQLQQR